MPFTSLSYAVHLAASCAHTVGGQNSCCNSRLHCVFLNSWMVSVKTHHLTVAQQGFFSIVMKCEQVKDLF